MVCTVWNPTFSSFRNTILQNLVLAFGENLLLLDSLVHIASHDLGIHPSIYRVNHKFGNAQFSWLRVSWCKERKFRAFPNLVLTLYPSDLTSASNFEGFRWLKILNPVYYWVYLAQFKNNSGYLKNCLVLKLPPFPLNVTLGQIWRHLFGKGD